MIFMQYCMKKNTHKQNTPYMIGTNQCIQGVENLPFRDKNK
jgi:hypothetical protein